MDTLSYFVLVNPSLIGAVRYFNSKTHSIVSYKKVPLDAAAEIWKQLSQVIIGPINIFSFSIQNADTGRIYHFKIKEKIDYNDMVNWEIEQLSLEQISYNNYQNFRRTLDPAMQIITNLNTQLIENGRIVALPKFTQDVASEIDWWYDELEQYELLIDQINQLEQVSMQLDRYDRSLDSRLVAVRYNNYYRVPFVQIPRFYQTPILWV